MVANAGLDNEKSALNYQVCHLHRIVELNGLLHTLFSNVYHKQGIDIFINTQVELLKDQMEEVEEQASLVTKELREKNRDYELLKRSHAETQRAVQLLQVIHKWGNLTFSNSKTLLILYLIYIIKYIYLLYLRLN